MRPGDRVEVRASWSSFNGMRGRLTQVQPFAMVVLDDDPRALRIEESSLMLVESERHMVAGE